jgi:hypothetical protein
MDNNTPSPIEVGTGVTWCCGTDRYPYTVVEVKSKRCLVIQRDNYERVDTNGLSEDQTYHITPDPTATPTRVITLRRNGRWCELGMGAKSNPYKVGFRRAYIDPCK